MKKLFKTVVAILCTALVGMFVACSAPGAPEYDTTAPNYAEGITESIVFELETFVTEYPDRTTFKTREELAAGYLADRLTEFGYSDVVTQEFSVDENNVKGLISHNVFAKLKGNGGEGSKNVVLGAYYDNRYSEAYSNATVIKSEAALAGGSGVASLLAVAKYLMENHGVENKFDYDVTIVFFGASYIYADGGAAFLRNGMTPDERKSTVLMVEMQRLGVDHVYAYSDARATKREGFFDAVAKDNGLDIYKPTQKSPAMLNSDFASGIPYFQWAHRGVFSVFAEADIPTLNLVGANWETMNIGDVESADNPNISYTVNDTFKVLKRYYPDYAKKMATAATLVIRSLEADDFISTMSYDRENYPDTDILSTEWIWYLIVAGVLAIAFGVVFAVNAHLAKKYRPEPRKAQPRLKMAVFGMDYEDRSDADIFIDIKDGNEEIFPGIPNNGADQIRSAGKVPSPSVSPFDNVGTSTEQVNGVEEAFEHESRQVSVPEPEDQCKERMADGEVKDENKTTINNSEITEENTLEENAEPVSSEDKNTVRSVENNSDGESASGTNNTPKRKTTKSASSKKAEPQIEIVKPAPKKRATVSAKKSVGAKKSTAAGEKKPEQDKKDTDN